MSRIKTTESRGTCMFVVSATSGKLVDLLSWNLSEWGILKSTELFKIHVK